MIPEAPQTNTTDAKTNTLDYALQFWTPAIQPGGDGKFGIVIRSEIATIRFPLGVRTSGEPPVPFGIVLRASD